jgi:hypothetical protein
MQAHRQLGDRFITALDILELLHTLLRQVLLQRKHDKMVYVSQA